MVERCQMAASVLEDLKVLNEDTIKQAITQMGSLRITRLLVTDADLGAIYDTAPTSAEPMQLEEIGLALDGMDVFTWNYKSGVMRSAAAIPLYTDGILSGCVYMAEQDSEQGLLFHSLQTNVLWISIVLELMITAFSLIFASSLSGRLRKIRNSVRIIRSGDYTHRLVIGGRDELTLLGVEFNELTERLQTSEEKRRQFVSDASHELKTPLASIKLLTDSILQNDMDLPTIREFVGDIGDEAERLNRVSQKLLALSKADSQPNKELEILRIEPTLRRASKMLSHLAQAANIQINIRILQDMPILISEDDLYEILFNLVENGIKYNVPDGSLTIEIDAQEENSILSVTDTGVGIPEESLSQIFERFYRVDKARSRKSGGSGLGLAIVKDLVEANGGTIDVTSEPGIGSKFRVIFPVFDVENG